MNTQEPPLPELDERRVDEIENALFADIARERGIQRARRSRRGRWWIAGGAAAAVVAIAAIIAPAVGGLVRPSMSGSAVAPATTTDGFDLGSGAVADEALIAPEGIAGATVDGGARMDAGAERDIMTSASATVVVPDVPTGADRVADAAEARGGFVASSSIGTTGTPPVDSSGGMIVETMPSPYAPDGAWVSVRVPSTALSALVDDLSEIGAVTASAVNRQDVTAEAIDLEARVSAAQASVDRLTELMAQAGSLTDLLAAESALSDRQANLASYQQQLEMLTDQVEMSSLTVTLTPDIETIEADPAGFWDGVVMGWNGLVATLNGIVIALGFLLPWLVLLGVVGFAVWGIRRGVKSRRRRRMDAAEPE